MGEKELTTNTPMMAVILIRRFLACSSIIHSLDQVSIHPADPDPTFIFDSGGGNKERGKWLEDKRGERDIPLLVGVHLCHDAESLPELSTRLTKHRLSHPTKRIGRHGPLSLWSSSIQRSHDLVIPSSHLRMGLFHRVVRRD